MKRLIICLLALVLFLGNINLCLADKTADTLPATSILTTNIQILSHSPYKEDNEKYQYSTDKTNEINFILHLLNSFELEKTETGFGSDSKYFSIPAFDIQLLPSKNSGGIMRIGSNNYNVTKHSVQDFLDYINAFKTGNLVLPDDISFYPSEWAVFDINQAISNGLVPKWNQINYTGDITRLEVCELAANLLEQNHLLDIAPEKSPFNDTENKNIVRLYQSGIIAGKSENQFAPYDHITREELAKVLANAFTYMGGISASDTSDTVYADQDQISDWAVNFVQVMTQNGIFEGNENGLFEPKRNISKQEVIVALLRLNNHFNNNGLVFTQGTLNNGRKYIFYDIDISIEDHIKKGVLFESKIYDTKITEKSIPEITEKVQVLLGLDNVPPERARIFIYYDTKANAYIFIEDYYGVPQPGGFNVIAVNCEDGLTTMYSSGAV